MTENRRSNRLKNRDVDPIDKDTESKPGKRRVQPLPTTGEEDMDIIASNIHDNREYIGLYSPQERKELFLKYFELKGDKTSESVHATRPSLENPYDPKTWPMGKSLVARSKRPTSYQAEAFLDRYAVTKHIIPKQSSATNPSLYELKNTKDYFKHVLNDRPDLFMKIVPLYNQKEGHVISDNDLDEVYTEVVVAYFLNELVYGYENVASLHFMTIVDWFLAFKSTVVQQEEKDAEPEVPFYHQVIVSEKIDMVANDVLENRTTAIDFMREVRSTLFQTFHALEVAWHTHKFTHNDLHLGNIMYKRIEAGSVLDNKNFLYNRIGKNHWYRIPKEDLKGKFVKIIDFGRNRVFVPTKRSETFPNPTNSHKHGRLICADGLDSLGISKKYATRRMDIYIPLLQILTMDQLKWYAISLTQEGRFMTQQFYSLCRDAIDWIEVNHIAKTYYKDKYLTTQDHPDEGVNAEKVREEYIKVGKVGPDNIRYCPHLYDLLRRRGIFIYKYDTTDYPLEDVLDHEFFSDYKQEALIVEKDVELTHTQILNVRENNVVVSFLQQTGDAPLMMASGGSSSTTTCSTCKSPNLTHKANDTYFCGAKCFEFKYIFEGKTVYR
jgi:hypothetical protein